MAKQLNLTAKTAHKFNGPFVYVYSSAACPLCSSVLKTTFMYSNGTWCVKDFYSEVSIAKKGHGCYLTLLRKDGDLVANAAVTYHVCSTPGGPMIIDDPVAVWDDLDCKPSPWKSTTFTTVDTAKKSLSLMVEKINPLEESLIHTKTPSSMVVSQQIYDKMYSLSHQPAPTAKEIQKHGKWDSSVMGWHYGGKVFSLAYVKSLMKKEFNV